MDVLATGYFLMAREAFRLLRRQDLGGSVIFIASKNGLAASPNASAYCAAKAAEVHLARCLALEGGAGGIRVNVVNPDAVLRDSRIWSSSWRRDRASAYGVGTGDLEEQLPPAQPAQAQRPAGRRRRSGLLPRLGRGRQVDRQRPQRRRRPPGGLPPVSVADHVAAANDQAAAAHDAAYARLGEELAARGLDAGKLAEQAAAFRVAVPSWGVGTGGTRFARFPGPGEPTDIHEKLRDCAVINDLTRITPAVSPHIPWDMVDDFGALAQEAKELGLGFDAVNSNTFQDSPGQEHSYKFGSLTHVDAAVRRQAVAHNRQCVEIAQQLGSDALTVWIADGSNFPGQQSIAGAFERYIESMREVCADLPEDFRVYVEYKLFEPAFYSTVICDWGSSLMAAQQLGPQAHCLVDLGHHAPNTNVAAIVARLLAAGKLGGFHFNENCYGDDDLDSGSVNPYRLFLIFAEMAEARARGDGSRIDLMIDQSHNVTDPIESLIESAVEIQRAHVQCLLLDRPALEAAQAANDAVMASRVLKQAFRTDVGPLLAQARRQAGGALDPIACYRASGYRRQVAGERKSQQGSGGGIV